MALIDGPDVVDVYVEELGTDGDGNRVRKPSTVPVPVSGQMQPLSAAEAQAMGQEWSTTYRFLCRSFPGGAFARVEWGGRSWDVQGEPQPYGGTGAAANVSVILRARDPRPLT